MRHIVLQDVQQGKVKVSLCTEGNMTRRQYAISSTLLQEQSQAFRKTLGLTCLTQQTTKVVYM